MRHFSTEFLWTILMIWHRSSILQRSVGLVRIGLTCFVVQEVRKNPESGKKIQDSDALKQSGLNWKDCQISEFKSKTSISSEYLYY